MGGQQTRVDELFGSCDPNAPKDFSREGILKAVTVHIATNDQAFELASKAAFRNCLVMMRPKSTNKDLPSTYDIKIYLRKEFVHHMKEIEDEVKVSPNA
ncbi:hypothetical protein EDB89DRAFT_1859001 [Lactarius sanguifluus]|nr:hypothetical protein EDB89DRAFT_1859001 [Lactarius sanguifluus]